MDGKGRANDNIFIERFWRSLKYDSVYIKCPKNGLELNSLLDEYVDYYNNKLCHQGIDHKVPVTLYMKSSGE